jgi:hypothetical protein
MSSHPLSYTSRRQRSYSTLHGEFGEAFFAIRHVRKGDDVCLPTPRCATLEEAKRAAQSWNDFQYVLLLTTSE